MVEPRDFGREGGEVVRVEVVEVEVVGLVGGGVVRGDVRDGSVAVAIVEIVWWFVYVRACCLRCVYQQRWLG